MSEQQHQHQDVARTQTESQAAAAAHKVGMQFAGKQVHQRKQNPQFYEKYTSSSLEDSEKWSYLINEFEPWLADDHVLANRRQVYRLQRELLNKVRAEQAIVGATPGVRLREKPLLNALAQGIHPELDEPIPLDAPGQQSSVTITDPDYTAPMDSEERTTMDDVANLATARQSMGVDQSGSEALTTATSENRTVREDESEQSGTLGSISGVFD
jgi:hypothetical protein